MVTANLAGLSDLAPSNLFPWDPYIQKDTGLKKETKLLGMLVLAAGMFALYLATVNLLYWVGLASLPLGSLNSAFVFPLIILSGLGSIVVNKRRVLENARSPTNRN